MSKVYKKLKGKIIRILDSSTFIIDLGSMHGITDQSTFSILGGPETVVDPFTNESLGVVSVVKGRVKATSVSEKFTIATSKWTERFHITSITMLGLQGKGESVEHGHELRVESSDIKPWKALSKDFVRVGDEVEVEVAVAEESKEPDDQQANADKETKEE